MSITQEAIRNLIAEYSGLGFTGTCTAAGSATTLIDARRLGTYAADMPEGMLLVLKFTKTATTISFDNASGEIRDSGSGLAAYRVGDIVTVAGSTSNDGNYTITVVAAGVLTTSEGVTDEAASASITLTTYERNWLTDFDRDTGTLTFTPGGNTSAVGHTYSCWEMAVEDLGRVDEAIDRALTLRCRRRVLSPVTILLDGDMEKATYADWTAGGSGSFAKSATTEGHPVRQQLYVTITTASADYVSQALAVIPDEQYALTVLFRMFAVSNTPSVNVYDVSKPADVSLSGDDTDGEQGYAWQVLRNTFTVPTDCRQIRIEAHSDTDASYLFLGWVALTRRQAREVVLPDRIREPGNIGRVFKAVRQVSTPYEPPGSWRLQEVMDVAVLMTRGTGGVVLRFGTAMGDGLYFYEESQPYTALATDADTTECPENYVCYVGAFELANAVARRQQVLHGVEEAQRYIALRDQLYADANRIAALEVGEPVVVVRTI